MTRISQMLALVGLLFASTAAFAQRCDVASAFAGTIAEARTQLEAAVVRDQLVRKNLGGVGDSSAMNPLSPEEKDKRIKERLTVDRENLALLDTIVCKFVWPTKSAFGEKAALAAFLIVQHSPLPVQETYLPSLKAAVVAKEADPTHLATLEDRINVRNGRPQVYGSQVCYRPGGGFAWRPLVEENEAKLDAIRASIGLRSISQYAAAFGGRYTPPSQLGCK